MQAFTTLESSVAPLDRNNVDTDQIIPKQFLRAIGRGGFGDFLFDEWRYLDRGELGMDCSKRPQNKDFSLNNPKYAGAKILLARDNFGCGSSREHAVWALADYGFRAIIAPSFGEIFYNNAIKNGLLPVPLNADVINNLFAFDGVLNLHIDLSPQTVNDSTTNYHFTIAADDKERLLNGLDDISLTLQHREKIAAYEKQRSQLEPWLHQ